MSQSNRLKAQNQQFKCCKHSDKVAFYFVQEVVNQQLNYYCKECSEDMNSKISIKHAKQIIEDNLNLQNQVIYENISQQLENFEKLLNELQNIVINKLKVLNEYGKEWINEIKSVINQEDIYDFIFEIQTLIEKKNISQTLTSNYSEKLKRIQKKFTKKFNEYLEPFNDFLYEYDYNSEKIIEQQKNLENIPNQLKIDSNKITQLDFEDIQFIKFDEDEYTQDRKYVDILFYINDEKRRMEISKQIQQSEICLAIAFNNDQTIMVSTAGNNIKIWDFNANNIQSENFLKRRGTFMIHLDTVNCLVYSKKNQYFISGSDDLYIICWKLENNEKWNYKKQDQKHQNSITCLMLNKNEDILISGSNDYTIIIWKADLENSELKHSQNLDNHLGSIRALTFSNDESFFASCDSKKTIIIWKKMDNEQEKWGYSQTFTEKQQGNKLQFLNDQTLLWVSAKENYIQFYEMMDQTFKKIEKTFDLKTNMDEDEINFPICFYNIANLLFIRHKHNIYILKYYRWNQTLKIIQEIACHTYDVYGTVTNNAEFLVFWDSNKKSYSFYKFDPFHQ
ncbi:unnamed protein product [Paramecium sonneborni]|uniref:WD40-repeat-containing domain n=1 Tax=Paramecium sonneborni TaxID=65129 RepID=A0A8S1RDG5_9CILI|nr:unnamed protein product [Paramecium sonneborni]